MGLFINKIMFGAIFCILIISTGKAQPVDIAYINAIPSIRFNASLQVKKHKTDSMPELHFAKLEYCRTMDRVFKELIRRYYRKEDFSDGMLRSIEDHASLLTNIESPATVAQASSGYDALLILNRTSDLERLIPRMVQNITADASDGYTQNNIEFNYKKWLTEWKRADENLKGVWY